MEEGGEGVRRGGRVRRVGLNPCSPKSIHNSDFQTGTPVASWRLNQSQCTDTRPTSPGEVVRAIVLSYTETRWAVRTPGTDHDDEEVDISSGTIDWCGDTQDPELYNRVLFVVFVVVVVWFWVCCCCCFCECVLLLVGCFFFASVLWIYSQLEKVS